MVGLVAISDMDGSGIRSGVPASPRVVKVERRGAGGVWRVRRGRPAFPDDLLDLVRNGVTRSQDRSRFFMGVVAGLLERGFTVDGVYDFCPVFPDGISRFVLSGPRTACGTRLSGLTPRVGGVSAIPTAPAAPLPAPLACAPVVALGHASG